MTIKNQGSGLNGAHSAGLRRRDWLAKAATVGCYASALGWAGPAWAQDGASTAASAPGAAAALNKLEKRRVTMAVTNKAALAYLPLTVAVQMGYFLAEGIELEMQEVPSVARAQQLVTSGGADMVSGWLENTLALQGKGQAFVAFVLQGRTPQMALGVSTKTLPDAKSAADLRGKKIGIMAPGSPTHTIAHAVLARAGLRRSEMGFVSVGTPTGAVAALRAGQIDAVCYTDPLITQLEQRGELRIVADTRTLRGTLELCGGDMPSTCLYAPTEFVQKNPYTVQAVTHAMVHALKWLQTAGLSDLMKILPESYFAGDRALYLAAFARMHEAIALDGVISAVGVRNTLEAMLSAEPVLHNEKIDPAKSFTNLFALRSKQRFKA